METAFTADSPGWVLLAKEINWAIEQGMTEVDLMRGDEDYKYRFGGIDRHVISFKARLA
jgi:CelD/BcsL family acetyltransferase involved in cellulose biosynthesis